jgi:hypothetical protein
VFTKRVASESVTVIPDARELLRQVFRSLEVEAASEMDVRRMAKRLGVRLSDLSLLCETLPDGRLRLR